MANLVLTRRPGERIIIGDREIVLTVASVKGDKVRIAIEAPANIKVHREEVHIKIQKEKEGAA
jgi:carbon storage regulator